jgi:hypothetical protein
MSHPAITKLAGAFVAAVLAAGCSTTPPSASVTPTAGPTGTPDNAPSATAESADCPIQGAHGQLPSNRLVDVTVESGSTADRVTFRFGPLVASPAGDPTGSLAEAHPPFSVATSGAVIDVAGSRFLDLRFDHMVLADDAGNPTFTGSRDQEVEFPAVRQVTEYDESEGVIGWYVGIDGPGCVQLTFDAASNAVRLEVAHR